MIYVFASIYNTNIAFIQVVDKLPAMVSDPSNTENNYQGHLQITVW